MTILEFIARLVSSLAWPVATIAGLLILRRYIAGALGSVKRLKYSDFEMDFERQVESARAVVASIPMQGNYANEPISDHLIELAKLSPIVSVSEALKEVDGEFTRLAKGTDLANVPQNEKAILATFIDDAQLLDSIMVSRARILSAVKNFKGRQEQTPATALQLVDLIVDFRNLLRKVHRSSNSA